MTRRSVVGPEGQNVTFVELFFDLVFVFSVTQVVGVLHDQLDWAAAGRAVLVFWLVWWAWTQYTWALNAADTTHPAVELGTLLATGLSFFMAVVVPGAFGAYAVWFAVVYVLVRGVGLGLYGWVAYEADPSQRNAVRTFSLVSIGGLAAVLAGGLLGGAAQYLLWGLAIALDVVAAAVGGRLEGWNLRPEHFSERHGLFVIIALGESLIVAAGGLSGRELDAPLILVGGVAVATACALWWSYFACGKPHVDRAFETLRGAAQSRMARDVFSLLHFPMILGVIAFAAAVDEIVRHPATPLVFEARLALALGVALFLGSMVVALGRATGNVPPLRLVLTVATAAAVTALSGVPPIVTLGLAFAGVTVISAVEYREHQRMAAVVR